MPFYPHKSLLKQELAHKKAGSDYALWYEDNLAHRLANVTGPIVEIGGPTPDGFYFLDGTPLASTPIISNVSANPLPAAANAARYAAQVTSILDGTSLPYDNDSVGIFLMKGMSLSSDWWVGLPDAERDAATATFEKEYATARLEMGQVALGLLAPGKATQALRIKIWQQIYECLRPDGLFISDGESEDIVILQKLGFSIEAYVQYDNSPRVSYEVVLSKAA